jgi:hypothetical protein
VVSFCNSGSVSRHRNRKRHRPAETSSRTHFCPRLRQITSRSPQAPVLRTPPNFTPGRLTACVPIGTGGQHHDLRFAFEDKLKACKARSFGEPSRFWDLPRISFYPSGGPWESPFLFWRLVGGWRIAATGSLSRGYHSSAFHSDVLKKAGARTFPNTCLSRY